MSITPADAHLLGRLQRPRTYLYNFHSYYAIGEERPGYASPANWHYILVKKEVGDRFIAEGWVERIEDDGPAPWYQISQAGREAYRQYHEGSSTPPLPENGGGNDEASP